MQEGRTVRIARPQAAGAAVHPAGLLFFSPLPTPPAFRYEPLARGSTVLGRAAECGIAIIDDGVSRKHATLETTGERAILRDCESANGVIVDGRRVSEYELRGGEVIRLGDTFVRFLFPGLAPSAGWIEAYSDGMVSGPSLGEVRDLLERASAQELCVLILGETGTGKEVAASWMHATGARKQGPFVAINCAAIPASMVESELFGHVKGAFTGATSDSPGLIRQAAGGTLLLDEVGELPAAMQSKLLRVLQDRQVRPVGGGRATKVDLRIVCATNRDLGTMVRAGEFRADLYARIAELVVRLPALRERIEDLPLLAAHLLSRHAPGVVVSAAAIELLCSRRWGLNIRGLETAMRRAVLLARRASVLLPVHFPEDRVADFPEVMEESQQNPARSAHQDPRAQRIAEALKKHQGDASLAAAELAISRSQLYRRAKKYGIDVGQYKP